MALLVGQFVALPALAGEIVVQPIDEVPAPPVRQGEVKVDIDADSPAAALEPADLGGQRCLAPCGKIFRRDGYFRVTGDGLLPSRVFRLPVGPDQVTLDVQASSKRTETTGAVMGIGGLVVIGLSAIYLFDVTISSGIDDAIEGSPITATQKAILVGGFVGGLALSIVGALIYATSGTRVHSKGAPLRYGPPLN